jgi:hypothetical protein
VLGVLLLRCVGAMLGCAMLVVFAKKRAEILEQIPVRTVTFKCYTWFAVIRFMS